jgi:hypothetical protein
VSGYFPAGAWYDLRSGATVAGGDSGRSVVLSAPLDYINVHVRGAFLRRSCCGIGWVSESVVRLQAGTLCRCRCRR